MGTKMGAAGVRIELTDNSAYGMVENPSTIAGVVGFASKGELNKIITLANTAEQDTKLGYGFQSYKYNQGMYAARAVLNAGGHVEFVRPYGETIDKSDPYKRDLKTDAYVIAYDKNAAKYDPKLYKLNSLNLKHFASTRFKTDGAAEYGVTRKINNISETITEGNNVNFNIDASENFADSAACRWYDPTKKLAPTDMVLGAIMNTDPSNAYRAFDRYEVVTCDYKSSIGTGSNPILECMLATYPGFIVGDTVRLPISSGGTSSRTAKALVTDIQDKTVILEIQDKDFNITGINKPNAIIFCDKDNAMGDGYDYMSVKTAVAGRSVKTFTTLHWGDKDNIYAPESSIKNGTLLAFYDRFHAAYYLRFANNSNQVYTTTTNAPSISTDTGNWTIKFTETNSILVGDELTIFPANNKDKKAIVTVLSVDGKSVVTTPDPDIAPSDMVGGMCVKVSEFSEDYEAFTVDISSANSWEDVANAVLATLYSSEIGYGNGVIANDIGKDSDGDGMLDQWFDKTGDIRNVIWVEPSASYDYSIGDTVAVVRGKTTAKYGTKEADTPDMIMSDIEKKNVIWVAKIADINTLNGKITLDSSVNIPNDYDPASGLTTKNSVQFNDTKVPLTFQLVDLTNSAFVAYNAVVSQSYVQKVVDTNLYDQYQFSNGQFTKIQSSNFATKVHVGDTLNFTYDYLDADGNQQTQKNVGFTVTAIDTTTNWLTGATVKNLPTPVVGGALREMVAEVTHTRDEVDTYIVSNYSLYVSSQMQDTPQVSEVDDIAGLTIAKGDTTHATAIIDKSPKVLADSDIGATFLNLGLATTGYIDMNYDGNPVQVYVLNADGENIARMFMSVSYMYNGRLYEFEGTIVPYSYNDTQLFIGDAADAELTNSGATFVLNESGVLEYFLENISYDLSQTIVNGTLTGISTCISYNDDDPAIQNDAVWVYNPLNNRSGSTLSTAWNLFLDKDGSDVSMLVAAGCGVNNIFMKNLEGLNTQVMQAMLNVCELRKDCFAIMDGVGEAKLATALKKNIVATGFGSTLGRWGAIYDGRGIFFDSLYTKGNVEVVKSVQLASLITANRSGGIWWNVPSGKTNGVVPSAWGTREKYPRRFSYPEDTESDIAKLSDIHCNPTRSTADGLYIWGDFTMQMEDTAFNQIHVAMLMAGVHKAFYKYLDDKVFRLNTTNLRAQITSDLQAKLNSIITANPAGFYEATVICDDSNNTPDIIDQNKLYVDLKVKPTKSTRYIYLRSEVLATSDGNQITTTLS